MQSFFITATGTEIGKTLVTTALCSQLRQQGKKVTALKPVVSGFTYEDQESDPVLILKSCGLSPNQAMIDAISRWRFAAPIAPNMAARLEGKPIDLDALVKYCQGHSVVQSDALLLEGAGGVMAPLTDQHTMLDWMAALSWPVILVAGSYLGTLSHTLTAVEALRGRNVPIRALVVSESKESPVPLGETADTLEKFMPSDIPVVKIPRLPVKSELWKHVPPISWIINP